MSQCILWPVLTCADPSVKDNTPINFPVKELGTCEVYPQTLIHSPNGRFTAVCKFLPLG